MNGKMMRKGYILLATLLALVACSGGGGGGTIASGGIGGTGISFGPVTGFGSIFVNGVEFSTNGSTILRDGVSINENELRKGMIVEVQGAFASATSGSAATVTVEEAVRGPVESKTGTAATGTLVVLGQTVHVDTTTLFDTSVPDFASINPGHLLEVHGHRHANGSIAASFIERKIVPVVFEVRGPVSGHNALAQTFTVAALTVNYAGASFADMPVPSGSNWNGLFVEVTGSTCAGTPVCVTLTASKVEPEGLGVADADQAEIEGFVTALVSTADFTLNSVHVLITASTVFSGGLQSQIVVGAKLEVEGRLAGGVLTASKVEFEDNVELESNATVSGSTITLQGLPGVTVTVNAYTEFENTVATASNLAPLNGRNVEIYGHASGPTSVIATHIENSGPSDPNGEVILQGPVDKADVSNPTFKILGVTVDTSLLDPTTGFEGLNGAAISPAMFFDALAANGGLVKATGRLPAANAMAAGTLRKVELEN